MNKFDSFTAKKIISEYADKINYYMQENKTLLSKIEDLKTTIEINKNLMSKYIVQNTNKSEQLNMFNDLREENKLITLKYEQLSNDKNNLEQKYLKLNQAFEDSSLNLRTELENTKRDLFVATQSLMERNNLINFLKKENEQLRRKSGSYDRTIFVTDPTVTNMELFSELKYTRSILEKVLKLNSEQNEKGEQLGNEIQILNAEIENFKQGKFFTSNKQNLNQDDKLSISDISDDELSLSDDAIDSPRVLFPDKVMMTPVKGPKIIVPPLQAGQPKTHYRSHSTIPKLDLDKIVDRKDGTSSHMQTHIKNPCMPQYNEDKKQIEKLKGELKESQKLNADTTKKLERIKEKYNILKNKVYRLKTYLKKATFKIDNLESLLKPNTCAPSTRELSSHKNLITDNASMNGNISVEEIKQSEYNEGYDYDQ